LAESGAIRLLREPVPGLSVARNTGVSAINGNWTLFLDDDVLLPPSFLIRYANAMRTLKDFGFLAGAVIPAFDTPLRPWVAEVLRSHPWCFSALDLGGGTRALADDQFPFGANMAIRSDLARRFPFEPSLGFKHGSLVPGEETALFKAIVSSGEKGAWVADVPVRHRLPAVRATLPYLLRRAYGQGRAEGAVARATGVSSRWVLREAATSTGMIVGALAMSPKSVGARVVTWMRGVGHLVGAIRR
jgi:glycosyltransferase involved in cell wall biosynthesis